MNSLSIHSPHASTIHRSRRESCRVWTLCAWFVYLGYFSSIAIAQTTTPLQHRWEVDPDFGDIWARSTPNRSAFIDIEGLLSDQAQVRLDTARAICANYDRDGFQNRERALDLLMQSIERGEESPLLKRALIAAACVLDDGAHAALLWKSAQEDLLAERMVQRGLIRWKSPMALEKWRTVVRNASSSIEDLTLAIEGLGTVGESEDELLLREALESSQTQPMHRILAARALGARQREGLTSIAQQYLDSGIPHGDLVAAHLLNHHTDEASGQVLRNLHDAGSAPTQLIAAAALAKNFQATSESLIAQWLKKEDLNFRRLAMQAIANIPAPECIELAMALVQDHDATIRTEARHFLLRCSTSGHKDRIDQCVSQLISGESWQGIEQGIILAVELKDANRCEEFIARLDHSQAEVHMHAAWGLMELAEESAVLENVHQYAERVTDLLEKGEANLQKSETIRLSFLLELFGRKRYEPAYSMLMKYVPKNDFKMGNLNRASAIWSIGQMRQDQDLPDLRNQLRERIGDLPPDKPENYLVRFACIVALGRMGYRDSQTVIEQYGGAPPNPLGHAAQWSLQQIRESAK